MLCVHIVSSTNTMSDFVLPISESPRACEVVWLQHPMPPGHLQSCKLCSSMILRLKSLVSSYVMESGFGLTF